MNLIGFNVGNATLEWAESHELECDLFESIESTNATARELAFEGDSTFELFLAQDQTAGRGRNQNKWINTTKGSALLSSWSFLLNSPPQPITTARIGLAFYQALLSTWPKAPLSIKAPNDIFLGDRKLAGVLVETVSQGAQHRCIVGLGMNVTDHPRSLPTSTHLSEQVTFEADDWNHFLNRFWPILKQVIKTSAQASFTTAERDSLLQALNRQPGLSEKWLQLELDGTLASQGRKVLWQDL